MLTLFKDGIHLERFQSMMGNIAPDDKERSALFFIIAGVDGLFNRREEIYNFNKRQLNLNFNGDGDVIDNDLFLSSSEAGLLKLGIQLYNTNGTATFHDVFRSLDIQNTNLAINAIRIRYTDSV